MTIKILTSCIKPEHKMENQSWFILNYNVAFLAGKCKSVVERHLWGALLTGHL